MMSPIDPSRTISMRSVFSGVPEGGVGLAPGAGMLTARAVRAAYE
jgi:hypothetical protein